MTTIFAVCAVVGFLIAGIGALLDGTLDALDAFDVLPDWLSLPVIGAGVGAFGVAGLVVEDGAHGRTASLGVASVVGLVFAVGAGWFSLALSRASTDSTPTSASMVGGHGRVVTPIPAGARGEVLLTVGGHTFKLSATSAEELEVGRSVVAIETTSETSVVVVSQEEFWGSAPGEIRGSTSGEGGGSQ